ncbi:hypothetical protein IQ07DRAFT_604744 [Pyrenochaeta sp. DS3sAY3a]|nr:hypothetical protein IQ07DRAFT_604744 [Pyrenochaeta sp. DS3sAY3a]
MYLITAIMLQNISNPHDSLSSHESINDAFARVISVVGFCVLVLLCWTLSYFTIDREPEDAYIWSTRLCRLEELHPSTVFVRWLKLDKINHQHGRRISSRHQFCVICLEIIKANHLVRVLDCRHVYHKRCFDRCENVIVGIP